MTRASSASFLKRTVWLFLSAIVAWIFLCVLLAGINFVTAPARYWHASNATWRELRNSINILSRTYVLEFVFLAIPTCYSARLSASLWRRALVGAIFFGLGGLAWALWWRGVLGAIFSVLGSGDVDRSRLFWHFIVNPLIFFGLFFFFVGGVVFALLPARRAVSD